MPSPFTATWLSPLTATCLLVALTPSLSRAESDWPQFRGPTGDNHAAGDPPVELTESNRRWFTPIAGRAWSSPVVADGEIYVTTAEQRVPQSEERRIELLRAKGLPEKKFASAQVADGIELSLLTLDSKTGVLIRDVTLLTVAEPDSIHSLNSYASPTPVVDGDQLICHFGTFGTGAIDRSTGKKRWWRTLPIEHGVGPGSSPIVDDGRVILIQDGMDRQYVVALDASTGETLWQTDRPAMDAADGDQKKAYCTPLVVRDANNRKQLICLASQWMVSLDPETGSELWRVRHGRGYSIVPHPVCDGRTVYFSTGFGKPELWAVRIDGRGDVTDTHVRWVVKKSIPAKPSPVLDGERIYVVDDGGVATSFDTGQGEVIWRRRLGGNFSSSPLLAAGRLYFANHDGRVTVLTADDRGEELAISELGEQIMASPAVIGDSLIVRTALGVARYDRQ